MDEAFHFELIRYKRKSSKAVKRPNLAADPTRGNIMLKEFDALVVREDLGFLLSLQGFKALDQNRFVEAVEWLTYNVRTLGQLVQSAHRVGLTLLLDVVIN